MPRFQGRTGVGLRQAPQGKTVLRIPRKVLPIHHLGFLRTTGGQEHGAQAMPDRVVPTRRFVVGQAVLEPYGPIEVCDGFVVKAHSSGDLTLQHLRGDCEQCLRITKADDDFVGTRAIADYVQRREFLLGLFCLLCLLSFFLFGFLLLLLCLLRLRIRGFF